MLVALASSGICMAGPFDDGVAAYDKGQFDVALKLWLALAEHGDLAAQFNVAALYEKGTGMAADPVQAAHWYLEAAKQGDVDAELKIADLYAAGTGVAKDSDEARRWYTAASANPKTDKGALAAKAQARTRLASLMGATQEVFPYTGGRFVLVRADSGACVVALQGMITYETSLKFDDVVERGNKLGCVKPTLMLESPGGLVLDGIKLGDEVRAQGFQTVTRYECASSCALIFLGGVERTLVGSRAAIGLHQSADTLSGKTRCHIVMQEGAELAISRYYKRVIPATSDQVMDATLNASCKSIDWVHGQRAIDMGIATKVESADADVYGPLGGRR
ncbi:MAG: hypothetical protein ABI294_01420 [Casimicrobiaceae bacterium]